ncbi:hypothetical protein [Pseudomonas sp. BF-R-30]|uniref:hypothetical protein n=1 Tax=Pseudomonas sp. BF-R-30 TaxID=2832384 RepID=UPI001CBC16A5|nr:hypothetical protein [Pseudomonas sp. BF-R-30]
MTRSYITAEVAAQIIESAFSPLRCVAEPWDYGERVRFRVFDNSDQPVLTVEELLKKQFADANNFKLAIDSCRASLAGRGIVLDQWILQLPTIMSR